MVKIEHKILNGVELKQCRTCKQWLPLKMFCKKKVNRDRFAHKCRNCTKIYDRTYCLANKEKRNRDSRLWHKINLERSKANSKKWRERNPERVKELGRKASAERYSTLKGYLDGNIRRGIRKCLKSGKNGRTFEILGYSVEELKSYLTKTMPGGYCWEDYLAGKLHIDHKIPIAAHNFKSSTDIDFERCWALKNLQLLPAFDNLSKGNKLDESFQPSFIFS